MKVPKKYKKIIVEFCRIFLGLVFLFSGFVKAVDPLGTAYKNQDYLSAFGLGVFDVFALPLAFALLALEFGMGACLLLGVYRRFHAILFLLFMSFMTLLTLYLAIKNPVTDCGCFGDAFIITNWQTFYKNFFFLLPASVIVFLWYRRMTPLYKESRITATSFGYLFILGVSFYCYLYLPILDFRPYKIGNNLPQLMEIPEGAPVDKFEATLTYAKRGVNKEFTMANYPKGDSSWVFVKTETKLIEKGYKPPIHGFSIETEIGDYITDEVLSDDSYTFLLIAHRLDLANDSYVDRVNEIYDFCLLNEYAFYCLTSSAAGDIKEWKENTGAEYPFCKTDEITLKTIVRSNPGLLLLKGGTVINKWPNRSFPKEDALMQPLEESQWGQIPANHDVKNVVLLSFFFVSFLYILFLLDRRFRKKRKEKRKGRKDKRGDRREVKKPKMIQVTNPNNTINNKKTKKMRKNIVAGNWKMNKNLQEGIALAKELQTALNGKEINCDVVICPPFIHLAAVAGDAVVKVGAQNCADKASGAYTGEISAAMVASTGAQYVILGHSERRAYYGETSATLKEKVELVLANNLTPIFCIGEVLEEREAGKQNEVVGSQIKEALFDLSAEDFAKVVLAYEPVWAIGTGKTATSDQAQEMHAFIRQTLVDKYGKDVADEISILYGGSCNAGNAKELFANPDVDGGLIGGASLAVDTFMPIIEAF